MSHQTRTVRRARRVVSLLAAAAVVAASALAATPAGAAPQQRRSLGEEALAVAAGLAHPEGSPPGVNDWSCRPGPEHPRPVVLLIGTGANMMLNWYYFGPKLKQQGYCLFSLNYGDTGRGPLKALGDIPTSAREVAAFVDRVLAATGARQVDLVGHSQGGGVLPRWYLRFDGGTDPADPALNKVDKLIGIAPSNHGSNLDGLGPALDAAGVFDATTLLQGGPAMQQQLKGSWVNTTVDAGGDTQPGVDYTVISTRDDYVVTPYTTQALTAGPGATVRNEVLQDVCPTLLPLVVTHVGMAFSPSVLGLVEDALDPAAAHGRPCSPLADLG
ncbi:esterase/lipase family protein [Streptacidiphilus cavernicola]|uniref:Esterase/lipase family protein n=1 Tax=Streptacidiphilus cavernicola TaxID=3342716 RepID=A0ABV6VU44_9ACTN